MKEHDIVEPSKTKTLFQSQNLPLSHGQIEVGSEFDIEVVKNPQQKLFFDDLRGMLSVDEKIRKRTSKYKQSVLVGKVEEISEDRRIKIHIKAKGSNTDSSVFNYVKLEVCHDNNCEFSMDEHISIPTTVHKFEIEYD